MCHTEDGSVQGHISRHFKDTFVFKVNPLLWECLLPANLASQGGGGEQEGCNFNECLIGRNQTSQISLYSPPISSLDLEMGAAHAFVPPGADLRGMNPVILTQRYP